jgi:hypothetical protein
MSALPQLPATRRVEVRSLVGGTHGAQLVRAVEDHLEQDTHGLQTRGRPSRRCERHVRDCDLDVSRRDPPPGRPHFHATYGDDEASIDIESLAVIAGELPPRARRLVAEWARGNQGELRDNCERARRHEPLEPIEALR